MITAFLALLLASAPAVQAKSPPQRDSLYKRVIGAAVDRAHGDLVSSADFWVDHSRWEDPWIVESAHYEVRTTDSRFLAADIARNLEYMRDEFVKLLGTGTEPKRKFRVWIFPNLPAYNEFSVTNGAEHSSMYGAYHSGQHAEQPVVTYYVPNRVLLGMWITHAAAHQFFEQSFAAQPPVVVSEGLASYFSLFWDWSYGSRELKRLLGSGYIPLERLVREPIGAYVNSANDRFMELGMFFHYLLNYRDDTRTVATEQGEVGSMRDLLRSMFRGQVATAMPAYRMLNQDLAKVEADFKAFDFQIP